MVTYKTDEDGFHTMSSEIAEKLSRQTKTIVSRFEEKVNSFRGRQDLLGLTRCVDSADADAYAREYFGTGEHLASGIDGSMDFDERLQMLLFYANATAYSCPFSVGDKMSFSLGLVERSVKLSASAAVPLWLEDLTEVDPANVEIDLELEHSVERIPNAFMTLAELYLATKVASEAKIIFMDRPLSGTYATLSRDVRLLLKGGKHGLHKLRYENVGVSMLDVRLALSIGAPSTRIPKTPRYLSQRIIRELADGPLSTADLAVRLGAGETEVGKALRRLIKLDKDYDGTLLASSDPSSVTLADGVDGYWNRCVGVALGFAEATYERGMHPLSPSSTEWLTLLDVNTISFLLLQHLCEVAAKKRILLIGVAKDTTASDISRAVLPFGIREKLIRLDVQQPRLNNDRAFLTLLSAMNRNLATPWRTTGYDAAFSTIFSPDESGKEPFVPARRKVSRENLFVRGFFQLRTLGKEGRIRSPVFLFDRLFVPDEDHETRKLRVFWKGEETLVETYFEEGSSRTTNLILHVLSQCDNPEVFEAMGHNQLLYLADKAVKAEIRLMKGSLRGVANLSLGTMSRREQVTGIATSFREQRLEAEQGRARSAERN